MTKRHRRPSRPLGITTATILTAIQGGTRYGFDIIERTGLASGTVYPTLSRLKKLGYVRGEWEDHDLANSQGRPRRRYYSVTPDGAAALARALERVDELAALAALRSLR